MRGSWSDSIGIAGDANEILEVGQWLVPGSLQWPEETLAWLTADGSEPTWIEAVVLLDEADRRATAERQAKWERMNQRSGSSAPEASEPMKETPALVELDLVDIRRWRQEIREAADVSKGLETWSHSARLDGQDVSLQVHSSDVGGRWSGFTLAVFADTDTSEPETQETEPVDQWIRFDPQEQGPCRSWVMILSHGLVVRMQEEGEQAGRFDLERRDLSDPEAPIVDLGSCLVQTVQGRLHGAVRDVPSNPASWAFLYPGTAQGTRWGSTGFMLKSFDCSMEWKPSKSSRLRLAVRWNLAPRPRVLNLLAPIWPIARAITKRKVKTAIGTELDKMMSGGDWARLVELARR